MPDGELNITGPSTSYEEMDFGAQVTPQGGLPEVGNTPVALPEVFQQQNAIVVDATPAQPQQAQGNSIQTDPSVTADADAAGFAARYQDPGLIGGLFQAVEDLGRDVMDGMESLGIGGQQPEVAPQVAMTPEEPGQNGHMAGEELTNVHQVKYTAPIPGGPQ